MLMFASLARLASARAGAVRLSSASGPWSESPGARAGAARLSSVSGPWSEARLAGSWRELRDHCREIVAGAGADGAPLSTFWMAYRRAFGAPSALRLPKGETVGRRFDARAGAPRVGPNKVAKPDAIVTRWNVGARKPDATLKRVLASRGHALATFLATVPGLAVRGDVAVATRRGGRAGGPPRARGPEAAPRL